MPSGYRISPCNCMTFFYNKIYDFWSRPREEGWGSDKNKAMLSLRAHLEFSGYKKEQILICYGNDQKLYIKVNDRFYKLITTKFERPSSVEQTSANNVASATPHPSLPVSEEKGIAKEVILENNIDKRVAWLARIGDFIIPDEVKRLEISSGVCIANYDALEAGENDKLTM